MFVEEQNKTENLQEYAKRMLRRNIVAMQLVPGQAVSEQGLAKAFGISRTPISQALQDLAKYRVVDVLPQRGCRISMIDCDLVEEARSVREVLETDVLPLTCLRASERDIAILLQNVELQAMSREPDYAASLEMMKLSHNFHHELFLIARRENTYRMLEDISIHFDRVRELSLIAVKDREIIEDHRRIAEAIRARDAASAQEAIQTYLNRWKVDADAIRRACPQYIV